MKNTNMEWNVRNDVRSYAYDVDSCSSMCTKVTINDLYRKYNCVPKMYPKTR